MKHFTKNIKGEILHMKFKNKWEDGLKPSKNEIKLARLNAYMHNYKPKRKNSKNEEE